METTTQSPPVKAEKKKDIHVFKIKPIGKGETFIICQFPNTSSNNELCSLLRGGAYGVFHRGAVPKDMELLSYKIAPYGSGTHEIVIEADVNNYNEPGMSALVNFWSKHPLVHNKNHFTPNPNEVANPEFELEDLTIAKENKVVDVKRRRQASQKYEAMTPRGQKNVGYFLGVANADEIFDKDENDLYLLLLHTPGGKMYDAPSKGQPSNLDKFLGNPDFRSKEYPDGVPEYSDGDYRTQLAINTRRAIEKKIVDFNGKTYLINNHPVGETPEQVIGYLETNKDFYLSFVIEKLGDQAIAEKQEKRKAASETITSFDLTAQKARMRDLHEQTKALGITGLQVGKWATMKDETKIQAAIQEAEDALKPKNQGGAISTDI